jgi:ABC-type nitrate/sulfonate/bicarbonate transport system substrate-binding protein
MQLTRRRAVRVLAAASTAPWWMDVARAQAPATIRLAMIAIESAAPVYYAIDNGYFSKAGLDVQVTQNPSTPAVAAAVASGAFDIAYATISTLAAGHVRGLPFVVIAAGVGYIPGVVPGAIMVPVNSPIKTAKDCNGKTFATAGLGTIAEVSPARLDRQERRRLFDGEVHRSHVPRDGRRDDRRTRRRSLHGRTISHGRREKG